MKKRSVSKPTLVRLPSYLHFLTMAQDEDLEYISSPVLASALDLNQVQVRKDLALVSTVGGKPRQGYKVSSLIADIKNFLGYDELDKAVLVGAGNLGRALLAHKGYVDYGLDIVAAVDKDEKLVGTSVNGKKIYSLESLNEICEREQIKIGIITVSPTNAQEACDMLIESGVRAIWCFAQTHLFVPDDILVQYENTAASLAVLSLHLREKIAQDK